MLYFHITYNTVLCLLQQHHNYVSNTLCYNVTKATTSLGNTTVILRNYSYTAMIFSTNMNVDKGLVIKYISTSLYAYYFPMLLHFDCYSM